MQFKLELFERKSRVNNNLDNNRAVINIALWVYFDILCTGGFSPRLSRKQIVETKILSFVYIKSKVAIKKIFRGKLVDADI